MTGEGDIEDDVLAGLFPPPSCRYCCRPLKRRANSIGYCPDAVCRRWAYANDPEYRIMVLRRNAAWHKKKRAADPSWAQARREKQKARRKRAGKGET